MDYLLHRGAYSRPETAPRPTFVLLDLNMPRKTGYEALKEIKGHETLKGLPVVVLSTSHFERDILESCGIGANAYLTKPPAFENFRRALHQLSDYWVETLRLSPETEKGSK